MPNCLLRVLLCAALALDFTPTGAFCQTSAPPQPPAVAPEITPKLPEFEVASVKPNPKGGVAGFNTYPGGRIRCEYCRFEWLVRYAFDLQPYQIVGGPEWIHVDGYSIDAKPPATSESAKLNPPAPYSPLSDEQRLMLQALLIDRFQLKFHRENRTGQVYELIKGTGTLKLFPPKDPINPGWVGSVHNPGGLSGDGMRGQNISMSQLALNLSRYLEHPVLDKTGLEGSFDFEYQLPENDQNLDSQGYIGSIFSSLHGIGLNLKSTKGPVETIVIDHVERPSAN